MKEYKKKTWLLIVLILFFVLCVGLVFAFFHKGKEENKPELPKRTTDVKKEKTAVYTYRLMVRDSKGNPVEGVLAAFYDGAGSMIESPMATNAMGSISYVSKKKGTCGGGGVLAVPFGYKLDAAIRYFTEETEEIIVSLEDDPNAYVAYIGNDAYLFKDAIAKANEATEDITITLRGDVVSRKIDIKNVNGKNITIDGGGHTITSLGSNNAIEVFQTAGIITLKNMVVEHYATGSFIRTRTESSTDQIPQNITLNLKNVVLNAVSDEKGNYQYCLINLSDTGTTNLNMTNTKIKMKISSQGNNAAVIRTGNAGDVKTVHMTLKDCSIDASEAIGRAGIRVMEGTTADIVLKNTVIQTMDNYAVKLNGQKISYTEDCKFTSLDEWYHENPIELPQAKIGDTVYVTLKKAIEVANEMKEDVTIELLANSEFTTATIKNVNNRKLTINGNGYAIKATGDFPFAVTQTEGVVSFHNMTILHQGKNALVRTRTEDANDKIAQNLTLNFTDVKIYAEKDKSGYYPWGVFNLADSGTVNLNLVRTDIKMAISTTAAGSDWSVIRVCDIAGQKANITMTDSTIDATKAELRAGITVLGKTDTAASITLVNSVIKTKNELPIRVLGKATVYKDRVSTFVVRDSEAMTQEPIQAVKNGNVKIIATDVFEAQIGNVKYNTLQEAFAVANKAENDVTIELLANAEITTAPIKNVNNRNLTVNGNGYTIKTTGDFPFAVTQTEGVVSFHNMTILHQGKNALVRTRTEDANDKIAQNLTLNFTDVKIYAEKDQSGYYPWGVFNLADSGTVNLNLVRTDIKMAISTTAAGSDWSVIRVCDIAGQKANITMTDSTIDATKAELRAGITVLGKTDTAASITLVNSVIKTKNELPIRVLGEATIYKDSISVFDVSDSEEMSQKPIQAVKNGNVKIVVTDVFEAQIGDVKYHTLKEAFAAANKAEDDVTIELLSDAEFDYANINNGNNRNLTVNGNGHKITVLSPKTGTGNAFEVFQTEGVLTFRNMEIIHERGSAFVRTRTASANDDIAQNLMLNFIDVKISAQKDQSKYYPWGLFNLADSGTVNLNLVRTDIKMTISTTDDGSKWSVIRVGDVETQTANIVMTDSTIDAAGAEKRAGIAALGKSNTEANITLVRSKIETKNQYPIYIYGAAGKTTCNIYKDNSSVLNVSEDQNMSNSPIKAEASGNLKITTASVFEAQYEGNAFTALKEAIRSANKSKQNATIYMLGNVEFVNFDINNENGRDMMINGFGYQLTTSSNANTFQLMQTTGSFSLCDMTVIHNGTNQFIRTRTKDSNDGISQDITVNLTDVKLYAENDQTDAYKYGLINLADQGSVNLNLTRTRMNMKRSAATGGDKYSIIRVDRSEGKQEVDIVMTESIIDAGEAEGRSGIAVTGKSDTTAKITLKNTAIVTKNQYPIYVYGTNATCKVTVLTDSVCQFKVKENEEMTASPIYAVAKNNLTIIDMDDANK